MRITVRGHSTDPIVLKITSKLLGKIPGSAALPWKRQLQSEYYFFGGRPLHTKTVKVLPEDVTPVVNIKQLVPSSNY